MPTPESQRNAAGVDATTQRLIEQAQEQGQRGQVVTLEQAEINLRKQITAWQKMQAAVPTI